jgi:predicted nuclease of predicted toxin-antitoxin system
VRLKLDENLGRSALAECLVAGHDTSTIHLQNMGGAPDSTVHEVCKAEMRTLVTLDLDFANPLVFDPRPSAGCAVLRLPKNAGPSDVSAVLRCFLAGLQDHSIEGQLWIVRDDRIRIWQPRP